MDDFAKRWLTIWSWGVVGFGAVLAGYAFAATEGGTRLLFEIFGQPVPDSPGHHLRFTTGLMGCVTIGWGLTLAATFRAIHALDHATARSIWRQVTIGVLFWYVIDSAISIATGFWMNAVSNTIVVALYFVPVLRGGKASAH